MPKLVLSWHGQIWAKPRSGHMWHRPTEPVSPAHNTDHLSTQPYGRKCFGKYVLKANLHIGLVVSAAESTLDELGAKKRTEEL